MISCIAPLEVGDPTSFLEGEDLSRWNWDHPSSHMGEGHADTHVTATNGQEVVGEENLNRARVQLGIIGH